MRQLFARCEVPEGEAIEFFIACLGPAMPLLLFVASLAGSCIKVTMGIGGVA